MPAETSADPHDRFGQDRAPWALALALAALLAVGQLLSGAAPADAVEVPPASGDDTSEVQVRIPEHDTSASPSDGTDESPSAPASSNPGSSAPESAPAGTGQDDSGSGGSGDEHSDGDGSAESSPEDDVLARTGGDLGPVSLLLATSGALVLLGGAVLFAVRRRRSATGS